MLITLYKIGGVHFRQLGRNGFRVKAKKKRVVYHLLGKTGWATVAVNGTP